jgi:hypothetical protein
VSESVWTEKSEKSAENISSSQPERCYYRWKMQDESASKYNDNSGDKANNSMNVERKSTNLIRCS